MAFSDRIWQPAIFLGIGIKRSSSPIKFSNWLRILNIKIFFLKNNAIFDRILRKPHNFFKSSHEFLIVKKSVIRQKQIFNFFNFSYFLKTNFVFRIFLDEFCKTNAFSGFGIDKSICMQIFRFLGTWVFLNFIHEWVSESVGE